MPELPEVETIRQGLEPVLAGRAIAGIGVGLLFSVPLATGIMALEIIVVLVQAYVFALLSAVFIGMAIHVHH